MPIWAFIRHLCLYWQNVFIIYRGYHAKSPPPPLWRKSRIKKGGDLMLNRRPSPKFAKNTPKMILFLKFQ